MVVQEWFRRRKQGGRGVRPQLEALEDRALPSFAAGTPISVPPGPTYVVTADFNGDGIPDLAVASAATQTVTVLLGTGGGTFRAAGPPIPIGVNPIFMAVADLNGDHIPDLVVANGGNVFKGTGTDPGSIDVLLGNGDGSFRQAPNSPFLPPDGETPSGVAVADFNGDRIPDLAVSLTGSLVTGDDGRVDVLRGKGDGTFTENASLAGGPGGVVGLFPSGLVATDLNGDGKADLAVAGLGDDTLTVLLGTGLDGAAAFNPDRGSPYATGNSPTLVIARDFDGDGKPDLAVLNSNLLPGTAAGNSVTVLLSSKGVPGGALFGPAPGSPFATGTKPADAVVGDFNGDGRLDLAVTNQGDNTVSILFGNGDGTFGPQQTFAAGNGPGGVALLDLNGDGAPDLAVADGAATTLSVLLNQGGDTTSLAATINPFASGVPLNLVATVTPTVPGSPVPTAGLVTFEEGTRALGVAPLGAGGLATLTLPGGQAAGSYAITAVYGGGGGFFASTSAPLVEVVRPTTQTVLVAAPSSARLKQRLTLTATVSGQAAGFGAPGGSVMFLDGSRPLGTVSLNAGGQAVLTLRHGLGKGVHSLIAVYSGDPTFVNSASAAFVERVGLPKPKHRKHHP
jgi:hypothetical protein